MITHLQKQTEQYLSLTDIYIKVQLRLLKYKSANQATELVINQQYDILHAKQKLFMAVGKKYDTQKEETDHL